MVQFSKQKQKKHKQAINWTTASSYHSNTLFYGMQMANHTKTVLVQYSRHLNTGLVLFSNGSNMSGSQMVRFSNGIDIFDGHFGVCGPKPFENQRLKSPVFRWIRYSGVRFSNAYCIRILIAHTSQVFAPSTERASGPSLFGISSGSLESEEIFVELGKSSFSITCSNKNIF